jgi:hypothetical protein
LPDRTFVRANTKRELGLTAPQRGLRRTFALFK